jgi:hypothetical protein
LRLVAGADRSGDPLSQEPKSLVAHSRFQTGQALAVRGGVGNPVQFSL